MTGLKANIRLVRYGMRLKDWFRAFRSLKSPPNSIALGTTSSGKFVLGTQIAQASAAQQRHDEARSGQHSPLGNLVYSSDESRLWRWAESPVDRNIESIVANFSGLEDAERTKVRDSLTMDDFYTLLTFSRRYALAALRSGDTSKIEPAFCALAMIELHRVDWRDLLVASGLVRYAAQRLHAPVSDLVSRTVHMAEAQTAQALLGGQTTRIDLAKACGYLEASTSEGLALFHTDLERYSPKADLTEIAFASALALEVSGYDIENITVASDLPLVWLDSRDGSEIAKLVRKFSGCVCIHGVPSTDPDPMSSGQSLLVFLAEVASETDAREVATAGENSTNSQTTQIGLASGRLCAVIIQRSWMADTPPLEDKSSLERLRSVFERLLV